MLSNLSDCGTVLDVNFLTNHLEAFVHQTYPWDNINVAGAACNNMKQLNPRRRSSNGWDLAKNLE